jgi:hypothetical protein
VWVNCLENELKKTKGSVIVTDLRFPEEWEMLKRNGFVTVRVDRPDRQITRDPNHISEIALDNSEDFVWDFTLKNEGTLLDLERSVEELVYCILHKKKNGYFG